MTAVFEMLLPRRILFGQGTIDSLGSCIDNHGGHWIVVTGGSSERAAPVTGRLTDSGISSIVHSVRGEPTFETIRTMLSAIGEADGVIAIGGGSVIDAGKALAMLLTNGGDPLDYAEVIGEGLPVRKAPLPMIAVPTTAGTGSEATKNAVLKSEQHHVKVSLRSPLMVPGVALVDPALAVTVPPEVTAATGMDALCQLIEAFLTRKANPMTDALCRDGIERAVRSLRVAFGEGDNLSAREDMALAALYSGVALANAGLGAVHGFAGPLGGMFDAPHGAVCAALLPAVFKANYEALTDNGEDSPGDWKFDEVAMLLTGDTNAVAYDAVEWLNGLREDLGIPGLGAHGITSSHLDDIVEKSKHASSMKGNPVVLADAALRSILASSL